MRFRIAAALSVLASFYVFADVVLFRTATVDAQQRATSGSTKWTAPRTPWGHPDLQGVWVTDGEIGVPFERPKDLGEKAELTEPEFRERAERLKKRYVEDKKGDRGASIGNEGAASHWYEGGKKFSYRTSLVIDPPDGRIPPYTPEGQRRVVRPESTTGFVGGSFEHDVFDGPEDLALTDRCITRGVPNTWVPGEHNNGFQIVQSENTVVVYYERQHEPRVIPIDGRPHLNSTVRQWMGDSRGRWDGDTLVVDVTNFADYATYRKSGTTLHVIERYRRTAPDTVRVEITIDDPTTWTKPWTFAVNGQSDPNYWQIFEYACHEGNYAMRHLLQQSRVLEKTRGKGPKTK